MIFKELKGKKKLALDVSIPIILMLVLTILFISLDFIFEKKVLRDYNNRIDSRIERLNELGNLNLEDFPIQKVFEKDGLIEIDFKEFISLVKEADLFKELHIIERDFDLVNYKGMRNTRFFRSKENTSFYLTNQDGVLFESYEKVDNEKDLKKYKKIIDGKKIDYYGYFDYMGYGDVKVKAYEYDVRYYGEKWISISYKNEKNNYYSLVGNSRKNARRYIIGRLSLEDLFDSRYKVPIASHYIKIKNDDVYVVYQGGKSRELLTGEKNIEPLFELERNINFEAMRYVVLKSYIILFGWIIALLDIIFIIIRHNKEANIDVNK